MRVLTRNCARSRSKLVGKQADVTSVRGAGTVAQMVGKNAGKPKYGLKDLGYKVGMRDAQGLGAGIGGGVRKTKRI